MSAEVGQEWRDDIEGTLWRVVAVSDNGVYVRRADLYGAAARGQHAIQTHPSYFSGKYWQLVTEAA